MPTEQQKQKLNKYIDTICEFLQDQLDALRVTPVRQITQNRLIFSRMLSQLLYDAPKLHTGYASIRMIELKLANSNARPVIEHHHGRQNGGEALLQLIDRALYMKHEIDRSAVAAVVMQYCEVHYTTAKENATLRKHQKQCSSEAAYRRANVVLVDATDLFHHIGRQTIEWREQMKAKYQPIVDEYYNPSYTQTTYSILLPNVIN